MSGTAPGPVELHRGSIREALPDDAEALADLSGQLGYPVPTEEMAERLQAILADPRHVAFVWHTETGQILGFIHLFRSLYLEAPPMAEIGGLVVDARARSRGIGGMLVERGERWAIAQGLPRVRVRSRLERADAHRFYDRLGYSRFKQQQVFVKELARRA